MNIEEIQTILTQAQAAQKSENFEEAKLLAHEVIAELDNSSEDTDASSILRANALHVLSFVCWKNGNSEEAITLARASLDLSEKYNLLELKSKCLNTFGDVYTSLGKYETAVDYYINELALCEELEDKSGVANASRNIAILCCHLGLYSKALENFTKAQELNEENGDKRMSGGNLVNIGNVYYYMSAYDKALEYYGKAIEIFEEIGEKSFMARVLGNIGSIYSYLLMYDKALEYLSKGVALYEELCDIPGVMSIKGNIGLVYKQLGMYDTALEYYNKVLAFLKENGDKNDNASIIGNIGNVYKELGRYDIALEYLSRALLIHEEHGVKPGISTVTGNIGTLFAMKENSDYNPVKAEVLFLKAIAISTETGEKQQLMEHYKDLSELYENEKRWEEAHLKYKKYIELKQELNIEEVKKQDVIRRYQKDIETERTRAGEREKILDNILPKEITARLIKGENPIADHFNSVSVLFMDIVDFTPLAARITAQQLVHLLNEIFSAADGVMREYGLEKIKTIGDAYMAVAGAPTPLPDHTQRAAQAALKLLEIMKNLVVTFPKSYGDKSWIESIPEMQVRIGLHCGPAAAGVVGVNKFLYDLWGDAVNTAARMESHGEANRIHVSEEFRKSTGNNFVFTERGEMDIKGKGKMKTYFLEQIK